MKRALYLATLAAAMLVSPAFAQSNPAIQQAVNTVPLIRAQMNDPDSFVLIGVQQTKPTKKANAFLEGAYNLCYEYRSHNAMGGYGSPEVVLQFWSFKKAENNGKLEFIGTDLGARRGQCEPKNLATDLTAEVKASLGTK